MILSQVLLSIGSLLGIIVFPVGTLSILWGSSCWPTVADHAMSVTAISLQMDNPLISPGLN